MHLSSDPNCARRNPQVPAKARERIRNPEPAEQAGRNPEPAEQTGRNPEPVEETVRWIKGDPDQGRAPHNCQGQVGVGAGNSAPLSGEMHHTL